MVKIARRDIMQNTVKIWPYFRQRCITLHTPLVGKKRLVISKRRVGACRALGQQPASIVNSSHLRWKEAREGGWRGRAELNLWNLELGRTLSAKRIEKLLPCPLQRLLQIPECLLGQWGADEGHADLQVTVSSPVRLYSPLSSTGRLSCQAYIKC